jgi:hypothetical protein
MPSIQVLILLAILVLIIGIVIGTLVSMLWTDRQKADGQGKTKNNLLDLAHLWRDPASGRLVVEVDGKSYSNSKLLSIDSLRQIEKVATEWITWIRGPIGTPSQPASPMPVQASAAIEAVAATGAQTASRPVASQPQAGDSKDTKPKPPASIVGQIDEILQEMLPSSPLSTKAIRLSEDLHHGVIVWVGIDHYAGIDAVPDPEIQKFIRSAVSEWEKRTENKS